MVDEMSDSLEHLGTASIERKSIFHALNQKAIGRRFAGEIG